MKAPRRAIPAVLILLAVAFSGETPLLTQPADCYACWCAGPYACAASLGSVALCICQLAGHLRLRASLHPPFGAPAPAVACCGSLWPCRSSCCCARPAAACLRLHLRECWTARAPHPPLSFRSRFASPTLLEAHRALSLPLDTCCRCLRLGDQRQRSAGWVWLAEPSDALSVSRYSDTPCPLMQQLSAPRGTAHCLPLSLCASARACGIL